MKRAHLLFLLVLSVPTLLPAQQAAPELSIGANGGQTVSLYPGWPLVVHVTIMNSSRSNNSGSATSLLISPNGAAWTTAIQFTVLSSSRQSLQWPLQLIGTPSDTALTLPSTSYVRLTFQMSGSDVAALLTDTYQLRATLVVSNSNGWNGAVQSRPVTIQVAPEPALTPDQQSEKMLLIAEYQTNAGDLDGALSTVLQLVQSQAANSSAMSAAANLLELQGYPGLAFFQAGNALNAYFQANPSLYDPPSNLLTMNQRLLTQMVTPASSASPTSTSASSAEVTFSPADQTASLSATVSSTPGLAEGGTVSFAVTGVGIPVTSSPVTQGNASVLFTIPGGTPAGGYPIVATYNGTATFSSSSDSSAVLKIDKAPPTIIWANPANLYFGSALGSAQLNATSSVPGILLYNPPAGTFLPVGSGQSLSVTFIPSDTVDYNSTTATVSINVMTAALTITANNASRQYGQGNPPFTASYNGFVEGETPASLSGTLTCASLATPASSVGGGPYTINCSGLSSTQYAITFVPGKLTVTPTPLTLNATSVTRGYGAANPPLNNITPSGFVNGDTLSSLSGTLNCTTTASQTSPVGAYPITCSGLSSPNYSITYVSGTLSVTGDSLTIAASNVARPYGRPNPALTNVSYAGFVSGDTPASLNGMLTCTASATPASSVGTYPINCSGLTSMNYTIAFVPGMLSITAAPLTVSANNTSRAYGANNPSLTGILTGLQNADPITVNFMTAAIPASPGGSYPITPVLLDSSNRLSNYAVSLVNGTLAVVQETTSLNVSLSPSSIPAGQSASVTVTLTAPDMVIPIDSSVLAPIVVSSPVASDILSNNAVCTPVPSTTPGVASCTITITSVEPNGRTLSASFSGSTDLTASSGTADLIVTAALRSQQACIASDFRNVAVPGGSYVWFNSIFKVRDVTKQLIHVSFFQSSVQFQYTDPAGNAVSVNQALPDAKITIDPNATTASTSFDAINNVWITTIPWDLDDNSFLTGMPWLVPSAGLPADVEPVTVCGTFASDVASVDIGWRWAAAAYSSFSSDNITLGVKPMDTDHDIKATNHDHAGSPENYIQFVIPGARGKGGKNYTGTYSRSAVIE